MILVLPSNRPAERFYRGGRRITDFRGEPPASEFEPEDWVGSVTAVRGEAPSGLTVLAGGVTLAEEIASAPEVWLGAEHVAAFGADPMLLVKLLDAGQRLPVHAHPPGRWAAEHLSAGHGKTEAWYLLTAGRVHLGLARDLPRTDLADIVARQDTEALLAAMHAIDVGPGDVVHVPAGLLHAIGEGLFLVELQEPEDLSILVEWRGFAIDGRAEGHLGLGYETALDAVETTAWGRSEIEALVHRAGSASPLLPAQADPFFRVERVLIDGGTELAAGFAVAVVLGGRLTLDDADASAEVGRGATVLMPHAAGVVSATGAGELLVCRPPLPR